jgi:hypothetical protein
MSLVSQTRTPFRYCSNLQRHVGALKLGGMKSHDHHVLIQDILPLSIRHMLQPGTREAIMRLGILFQHICTKVVKPTDMADLKMFAAETLCLLELTFPPGFFDVMIHLVVHLVEELDICGPVHSRWCYSVECYMGVLARYVRDKARPEASMAQGYVADEALGFCTEYFDMYPHTTRRVWDFEEELCDSGEVLLGAPRRVTLSPKEIEDIHEYVLSHSLLTTELFQ